MYVHLIHIYMCIFCIDFNKEKKNGNIVRNHSAKNNAEHFFFPTYHETVHGARTVQNVSTYILSYISVANLVGEK